VPRMLILITCTFVLASLPFWLPKGIVALRMRVFAHINGDEGIPIPGDLVDAAHFMEVYSHPAADGRSQGAGLSDLFWYWLSPGAEIHQEHLEPDGAPFPRPVSPRFHQPSREPPAARAWGHPQPPQTRGAPRSGCAKAPAMPSHLPSSMATSMTLSLLVAQSSQYDSGRLSSLPSDAKYAFGASRSARSRNARRPAASPRLTGPISMS
jgi:hypothetical protein